MVSGMVEGDEVGVNEPSKCLLGLASGRHAGEAAASDPRPKQDTRHKTTMTRRQ